MAVLKNLTDGASVILHARHRFGRSRMNHTALSAAEVSGEHALIGFTAVWELRDLGSRNGTWVNGARLAAGVRHPLAVDDRIGFGSDAGAWVVTSVAPPSASAHCGDALVEGDGDLLALPSQDDPQWVFRFDPAEGWVGDDGPVPDGHIITIDGSPWSLRLPEILPPTRELLATDHQLGTATLHFAVSADEEYVELTVTTSEGEHSLPARAHHYLLLTLARAHRSDREGGASESAAGWRHTEDVQRMLKASKNQIYVSVHRLKKELSAIGFVDASSIVERRKTSQQLRIGISDYAIRTL